MLIKRPLVRFYGYVSGPDTLAFLGENDLIEVEGNTEAILATLKHCNGHNSVEEIVEALEGEVTEKLARQILARLSRIGVLIDSDNLFSAFHTSSANPMVYPHTVSPRTLAQLSESKDVQLHTGTKTISLVREESPLLTLLMKRKSHREFSKTGLSDRQLSGLLEALYGRAESRSVPSGGGLYPMSVMFAVLKETPMLKKGIYEYHRHDGTVGQVQDYVDIVELQAALEDDHLVADSSLVVFVVADMVRAAKKYSNRSYRHLLIEAGHMTQNAYLFSAEQGMGIVEYGGYNDRVLADLLRLFYPEQAVLSVLIAGTLTEKSKSVPRKVSLARLQEVLLAPRGPVHNMVVGELHRNGYRFPLHVGSAQYIVPTKGKERHWTGNAFSTGTSRENTLLKVLAEAWERYVPDSMHYARWDVRKALDIPQGEWVDPYDIYPIMKEQQKVFRHELSVFDPEADWEWVIGNKYADGSPIYIPVDAVYYQRGIQQRLSRLPCIWASSNGVAAHPSKETAVQSATLELIERDALMATWYGKKVVKALPDDYLVQVIGNRLRSWQSAGYKVTVLDITTDTVPVVLVLIHSPLKCPALSSGSAAAATYEIALRKAFAEAELMALSWSKRKSRGITPEEVSTVDDHGMLYADPAYSHHAAWLLDAEHLTTVPEAIMSVEEALLCINPCVVDMTPVRPRTGLQVVRTIVPDLLPINFGYGTEAHGHPRLNVLGLHWCRDYPAVPHFTA